MPDVLIAGAGPAGAIAALVLARAGVRVMLFDRARFPRDKLCGDTINPGALAILQRLGIAEVASGGLSVDGMIVTGESGVRCQARYGGGVHGRALRRCAFDVALLTAARRAGAIVEEGVLVRGPAVDGGTVRGLIVATRQHRDCRIAAPIVIAADGGSSRVARALGLAAPARRPRRWAVGAYFSDVDHEGSGCFGEMHVRRGRYIGVAPLPGGFTNACVVTADRGALRDPSALLLDTLKREPLLAPRFAASRLLSRPVCLGPLAVASREWLESTAGIEAAPASDNPSASVAIAIVEAVPIVMQVPGERAMPSSTSRQAQSSIVPARSSAQYFQASLPLPSTPPR